MTGAGDAIDAHIRALLARSLRQLADSLEQQSGEVGAANLAEPASERSGPSRDGTIQERVLRLLADSEGPMSATDIVKSTGGKRPSVFAVLSQLHKFGVIRRVSHGMYEAVKP